MSKRDSILRALPFISPIGGVLQLVYEKGYRDGKNSGNDDDDDDNPPPSPLLV